MNPSLEWIGISLTAVGTIIALWQVWDLKRTRKRKDSPFFELDGILIENTPWKNGAGEPVKVMEYTAGGVEVPRDYPKGQPVLIRSYNKGGVARMVRVSASRGLKVRLWHFTTVQGDRGLEVCYSYDPARRGKKEKITVRYETESGEDGYQVFEHNHGYRVFDRIKIK